MPKRIALGLINLLWYSAAALIVITAMLVAIGREMLPRINLANDDLLQYINQRTGAKIQATQITTQWTSLYPELNAKQLVIDTGDAHVQLDDAHFTLNLLQSMLQLTPVIDRMQLAHADIFYRLPNTSSNEPIDLERDWHIINRLLNNDVAVKNIDITLQHDTTVKNFELDDFRVEQGFSSKKFFLKLIGDKEQTLSVVGRFTGNTLRQSKGLLYIRTDNLTLGDWVPEIAQGSSTSGEAWVKWNGMKQADITARIKLLSPSGSMTSNQWQWPAAINTTLTGHWESQRDSYIDLLAISIDNKPNDKTTPPPVLSNVRFRFNTSMPEKWRIETPALHLDDLIQTQNFLPDNIVRDLLSSLNPHGYLRNLSVEWDNSKPLIERMQLRANADNISSGPWEGVPAFTGVSGYIQSGIGYGFIDLNSDNGFSMLYPGVYHEPIAFQRAAGRVQWQWSPEQKAVFVGSDYASLSGEPGEARGSFWLHLPLHDADFHGELFLSIGLRNSQSRYRHMLIPYILPSNLLDWLKRSIGDADLPDAGFLYRGGLSGTEAHNSAVQFYANIRNGDLQFHPEWPSLRNIDARLLVDDREAFITASRATLYNTVIDAARIEVLQEHPGLMISVNGRAHGSPDEGLRLLRETPLHHAIGDGMDQWKMPQGSLETALQLQIPIAGTTLPPTENVQLRISNAVLDMKDLRLPFQQVNGNISYDSDNGLHAPAIQASLFDKPVAATITSKKTEQGTTTTINANSSANISDIAQWSNITPLKILSGSADYNATLQLGPLNGKPHARLGQLQITSHLNQIAAPLPDPFAKKTGTATPFKLTVDLLQNNQQEYRFDYNHQVFGTLFSNKGSLTGGDIQLLGNTPSSDTQNRNTQNNQGELLIHGAVPNADIQQWVDLVTHYNTLGGGASGAVFPSIRISAQNAIWKNYTFPTLHLSAEHNNDDWQLSFNAGNALGKVIFYDNNKTPDVIVDTLRIERNKTTTTTQTQKTNTLDFSTVPSLNIAIKHLFIDGMDIGNISTALRSSPNTLRLENLMATGQGYLLRDGSGLNGSTLLWHHNPTSDDTSEFHGALRMSGEQPVLTHLGVDPFIIGKEVSLFADITWPGAPQDIGLHHIAGSIYTEGKDGKYLQAKPNIAMHALGIVNITTWVRRLQLDFSDLRNDGISFDKYKGKLLFGKGTMQFIEPLVIESPSSKFRLSGKALLDSDTLDLRLVATLPVSNNAAWVAAIAGGLPAAAGVYLASKVFDKQISSLSSLSYRITGPMNEPNIEFERIAPPEEKMPDATTLLSSGDATK